ncbi:MAG: gamma-glutamyltransferase, partial [Gammaproteobacteria bacterium]
MSRVLGAVAGGHPATVAAAEAVLREGGNAFDAVVAAQLAACVAEPVLSSLGGGGFLLAHPAGGEPVLYDFFGQTPRTKRPLDGVDFHPVLADFGTAQQEFHIGLGAAATPGCVRGLFDVHRELCTLPMTRLVEPAVELAREGVELNAFQAYIFSIVAPIYLATPAAREVFADAADSTRIAGAGRRLRQCAQADFLEALAREGAELFYRGEVAHAVARLCGESGGHLTREDLDSYRTVRRKPLRAEYRGATVFTNPPPASGGILIAFALDLLEQVAVGDLPFGSAGHLGVLAAA